MDAVSYSHADKQKQRIEKFNANPDSNSGIVTVPKTIGAGESVTVPAGRVAVLPNVQVDGEIVVEGDGEIFIPAGAGFNDLDQRIDDKLDKDFSSFTDKITPEDTDNLVLQETGGLFKKLSFDNLMNWIKSFSFGWGQTWQNVTASRALNVTYTNSENKAITICVSTNAAANSQLSFYVNGALILEDRNSDTGSSGSSGTIIVPMGSTYLVKDRTGTYPGTALMNWSESK